MARQHVGELVVTGKLKPGRPGSPDGSNQQDRHPKGRMAGTDKAAGSGRWRAVLAWARLLVTVAVVIVAWRHWDTGAAFFLGMLAASVVGLIDARISVVLGLLALALCPLLLVAEHAAWLQRSPLVDYYLANSGIVSLNGAMETVVLWAYYLLCIGAAAHIVSYLARDRNIGLRPFPTS